VSDLCLVEGGRGGECSAAARSMLMGWVEEILDLKGSLDSGFRVEFRAIRRYVKKGEFKNS
jgi:hypothetical protein